MRPYMRLGDVPRKRHIRVEREGRPVFEELFGREGFSGPSSLLYHRAMPEAAHDVAPGPDDTAPRELEQVHGHAHLEAWRLGPEGDAVSGRRWLLVNDDVRIGVAVPAHPQQSLYVNGSADEVVFLHHGSGALRSQFGTVPLHEGDYAVIPRGTIHRLDLDDPAGSRLLVIECAGFVDSPTATGRATASSSSRRRTRERDVRGPVELESADGPAEVWLKRAGRVTRYCLDHHPFDVVGWDGTVYPYALSVHDFEPRAGRFHVPPPTHQVFQAHNLVICNFVPRKVDWIPRRWPSPITTPTSTPTRSCTTRAAPTPPGEASARARSPSTSAVSPTAPSRARSRRPATRPARSTSSR